MNEKKGEKICRSQNVANQRGRRNWFAEEAAAAAAAATAAARLIAALSPYCVDHFPDEKEREKGRGRDSR